MEASEGDELEDESIVIMSVYRCTDSYKIGVDKPMLRKIPHEAL